MKLRTRRATAASPEAPRLRLCLYTAGDWPQSQRAMVNLLAMMPLLDADLELVDALEDPARGIRDGIFVTPTLVRLHPEPHFKILGDLSDKAAVLAALRPLRPPSRILRARRRTSLVPGG